MENREHEVVMTRSDLTTPAFVIDLHILREDTVATRQAVREHDTRLLFPLKAFSVPAALQPISDMLDGFAASSLFELQLAQRLRGNRHNLHLTTPGLRPDEIGSICKLVDYLTFNSISQWQRYGGQISERINCGLRVNPQRSFVEDSRYDPCRYSSKLGVPLDVLKAFLAAEPKALNGVKGLHFHTNCDSNDLQPLLETVEHLLAEIDPLFDHLEWVNLGGGYLFHQPIHLGALIQVKEKLRRRGPYKLFMEPGASVVRRAGFLVSSVIDLFPSSGREVAVLDTTVNHMPEVFEYQFEPDVIGDIGSGDFCYLLAGSSCLAGDLFGEYAFEKPLEIGSQVVFRDMGAYSFVKANMFNGINLPTVYLLSEDSKLQKVKDYSLENFLALCGE